MAAQTNGHNGHAATELGEWREHTRVFLQPIAAPSILGLFGFAAATFMVAANLAGWYGGNTWPELGYWFLTLGAITGAGAIASAAQNLGLTATLVPLSVGSILLAVFYLVGGKRLGARGR